MHGKQLHFEVQLAVLNIIFLIVVIQKCMLCCIGIWAMGMQGWIDPYGMDEKITILLHAWYSENACTYALSRLLQS